MTGPTGTTTDGGGGTDGGDGTDGGSSDGADTATASPTATTTATATPGGGGGSATPTPTPTPSGPTERRSFPPGTNGSGVTDRTALFDAHQSALGETDYAVNLTQVIVGDESRTRTVSIVRSDLDGGRLAGTFLASTNNVTVDTFRNESRLYRRQTVEDRTSYRVRNTTGTFRSYHDRRTSLVESSVSVYRFANYTANGTVERDGRTLARFDLDAVNGSAVAENVTVTSAEGTLLVDDRGLIVRSTLELRGESDSVDDRRLFVDYRVTETGEVTVDRPDWLPTAEQESG